MAAARVLGVIPARLGAERLPDKPLRMLAGKPLIERVARNALESGVFEAVVVATDADEIVRVAIRVADAEGADHCVEFLNRIKSHAEDKGVTVCMEYLNSKVNHKDYMFDHIAWGVDVMKRVNSPRVKILYDIYHAQIMDGDIVRSIRDHFQWIGHFHTGGNPGRHEIDDTQELNYHFIAQAIADLNYTGYVAHEYSPAAGHAAIASLTQAMKIMQV